MNDELIAACNAATKKYLIPAVVNAFLRPHPTWECWMNMRPDGHGYQWNVTELEEKLSAVPLTADGSIDFDRVNL